MSHHESRHRFILMNKRLRCLSLSLIAFAFAFGGTWWGFCLGDLIFEVIGIAPWSQDYSGTHYVALFALIPLIAGIFLFLYSRGDNWSG